MKISRLPTISDPIYLSDISPDFAEMEGDVQENKRVWVKVKQATEGDNEHRVGALATRRVEWAGGAATETVDDNVRTQRRVEAHMTIMEVGNLVDEDGGPYFKKDMGLTDFNDAWWALPTVVTDALHTAVLQVNPQWDWRMAKN